MLNSLRKKIDRIDADIVTLLLDRYRTVKKIGTFKEKNSIPVEDKKREKQALENLLDQYADNHEEKMYIAGILGTIHHVSKRIQKGDT